MLDNDVYITDKETSQRYMYYIDLLWIGICKCRGNSFRNTILLHIKKDEKELIIV